MQHSSLENGRWADLTFSQQMANIGSESYRIYKALESGKESRAESCFARFQELIDLTIQYGRQNESPAARSSMRKELCRFREMYCGAFLSRNMKELSVANRYLDLFARIA
ncbi:MAG: hypothetical protein J6W09_05200 [Bacteroidales bacterium]|nr:hypothetical protein [Bacteroidales bacterium]